MKGKVFGPINKIIFKKANLRLEWGLHPQKLRVGDSLFGNEADTNTKSHKPVTPLDSIIRWPGIYAEDILQKRENHRHIKEFAAIPNLPEYAPPPCNVFIIVKKKNC